MTDYITIELDVADFGNETASKAVAKIIHDTFDRDDRFRLTLMGFEDDRAINVTSITKDKSSMSHQEVIDFTEKLHLIQQV